MNQKISIPLFLFLFVVACSTTQTKKNAKMSGRRTSVKCMENSPERSGEEGCSILANRRYLGSINTNLYWHIDRFDSLESAVKAADANGVATAAHGFFWLMTVETETDNHRGGLHVASIGPFTLPVADSFSMRVQSSLLMPGSTTPVHIHSGPEVIYVVDGEQCMEMPEAGLRLSAGQSYVIPSGGIHRGRVIGSMARRAFGLILHDAGHPASHDLENSTPLASCN